MTQCPICENWVRLEGLNIDNPNPHAEACPWFGIDIPQPDVYLIFCHVKAAYQQHRMKLGEVSAYLGIEPEQAVALFAVKDQLAISRFINLQRRLPNLYDDPSKLCLEISDSDQGDGCPHCGGKVYMVQAIREGVSIADATDPEAFFFYTECLSCAATGPWQITFDGAIAWYKMRHSKPQK